MSYQQLSVDSFLERVADMPDIEAVQEIDLRLSNIAAERKVLLAHKDREKIKPSLEVLNADETQIRLERHMVVMRMDRMKWSKAVRAIWGTEGVEQVLIWFEAMSEPKTPQAGTTR